MKRVMALTAAASLAALFALASQAHAQDGPTLSADPAVVDGPGTNTFTLAGGGWSPGLQVFIVPCTVPGEQLTTATPPDELAARLSVLTPDNCALIPIGGPATAADDGTFTVEVTHDVPANFAFGAGDIAVTENSVVPVLFMAEDMDMDMGDGDMDDMGDGDMGDDMAPMGGADTGLGGTAGSDSSGIAVPLAATLAAVTLLGGAALVARRNT